MSWVPGSNKGRPLPPTNYQHPNEYDHIHQFLRLSTPSNDGFNLILDPHFNTQNTPHFHEFLPPPTHNYSSNNNGVVEVPEIPDTCFNYITELLKDDNPEDQTVLGTLQDYMAYQSYYQSFTDTLGGSNPNPPHPQHSSTQLPSQSSDHPSRTQFVHRDISTSIFGSSSNGSNSIGASAEDCILESQSNPTTTTTETNPCSLESSLSQFPLLQQALFRPYTSNLETDLATSTAAVRIREDLDGDDEDERRSKQNPIAAPETYDQISEYEENIFCPEGKYDQQNPNNQQIQSKNKKKSKSKKNQGGGGRRSKPEVVDLMSLLINCAESVSRMDIGTAREQLNLIRKHSSPHGDNLQRVSHYLVNALEQRLTSSSWSSLRQIPPPATDFLRASRIYVAAAPFNIMSYYVCNKTIHRLAGQSSSVHIIDFGIAYGLQWPCIIYNLSKVEPTPPRLRITGIDFPESGFRPGQRLEETGRCLRKYSERFKVELEYKAIVAERWESVTVEEIGIRRDEFTVVNSLYRSQQLYDESVDAESSPRDAFLEMVRKIRPNYFVHGVVNGNLNAPFFIMRFKEAVTHYAALFEVFEATMPREDPDRAVLEGRLFGETLRNVVACESTERLERPETYRRWQTRKARAGFRQVPLEREMLRRAKAMVQRSFRKEFMMEEDCGWAVQGWKGRILYAISCWMPQDG
ncbi:hypothetical protein V2J09_010534 [Rumex salicifolius]